MHLGKKMEILRDGESKEERDRVFKEHIRKGTGHFLLHEKVGDLKN